MMRAIASSWVSVLILVGEGTVDADITVRGVVKNPMGQRLRGTEVRVFSGGEEYTTRTDDAGAYFISVPSGAILQRIEFNHSQWHVRCIEELSGFEGDDHVINKMLLKQNGPDSFDAIVDQLLTYERLFYYETLSRGTDPAAVAARYGSRICGIPDPRYARRQGENQAKVVQKLTDEQAVFLIDQLDGIRDLYGIRCDFEEEPGFLPPAPAPAAPDSP